MYRALFLSPMIPSFNMTETARFFREVLGFASVMDTPQYAIYQKDNLSIHILPAGKEIGQMEFYLEVDDLDGLWASIRDKVQGLKVREPFDATTGCGKCTSKSRRRIRCCSSGRRYSRFSSPNVPGSIVRVRNIWTQS